MHTTARVAGSMLATAVTAGLLFVGTTAAGADQGTGPAKPGPSATHGATKVLKGRQSLPVSKSLKGDAGTKRVVLQGWSYDGVWHNNIAWGANVRIDSGRYGAYTKCSDGSVRTGPLQGPGYWKFGGNCEGAGHLTGFGVYGDG